MKEVYEKPEVSVVIFDKDDIVMGTGFGSDGQDGGYFPRG